MDNFNKLIIYKILIYYKQLCMKLYSIIIIYISFLFSVNKFILLLYLQNLLH